MCDAIGRGLLEEPGMTERALAERDDEVGRVSQMVQSISKSNALKKSEEAWCEHSRSRDVQEMKRGHDRSPDDVPCALRSLPC